MKMTRTQAKQLEADMEGTGLPESVRTTPWRLRQELVKRYGHLVGAPESDEGDAPDHLQHCLACGQAYDKRFLWQVIYHRQQGHRPLPNA